MSDHKFSPKQLQKRERVLDAAIYLFAQKGFGSTTVKDIAQEAGISFGSVFTYFENKEALFEAALLEPWQQFRPLFSEIMITKGDYLNQLEKLVAEQIMFIAGERDYLQLMQQVLGQPANHPKLMDELDHFFIEMRDALIPIIETGQKEGYLEKHLSDLIGTSYISFLVGIRLTLTDKRYSEVWAAFVSEALRLLGVKETYRKGGK